MTDKFKRNIILLIFSCVGSFLAWVGTNLFIIEISFIKLFGIEIVISLFHQMFNNLKKSLN